jgi:hypothetical protein
VLAAIEVEHAPFICWADARLNGLGQIAAVEREGAAIPPTDGAHRAWHPPAYTGRVELVVEGLHAFFPKQEADGGLESPLF